MQREDRDLAPTYRGSLVNLQGSMDNHVIPFRITWNGQGTERLCYYGAKNPVYMCSVAELRVMARAISFLP